MSDTGAVPPSKGSSYEAKAFYQQTNVAARYDAERFSSWRGRIAHRMEFRAAQHAVGTYFRKSGTILDLPCGTGRLLEVYARGDFKVTGADISEEMLNAARKRFNNHPRFSFRRCDAERLEFDDNSFDYLVSFRLMCHLPPDIRRRVLSEMVRVTRYILVVNYHFSVNSPLMLINRLFRRKAGFLPYPLRQRDLSSEIRDIGADIVEARKLSWYERISSLVVMRKRRTEDAVSRCS